MHHSGCLRAMQLASCKHNSVGLRAWRGGMAACWPVTLCCTVLGAQARELTNRESRCVACDPCQSVDACR